MKRISSFFKSFNFIFLLALVVLALVIYFYGPHVPLLREYRTPILWALVAIYFAYYAFCLVAWSVKKWRIRRARRRAQPEEAEVLQYLEQVETFIQQAAHDLGLRRSLRKMPLHLVTGGEQAGKTAFIQGCHEDSHRIRTQQISFAQATTSWHVASDGIFFEWPLQASDAGSAKQLTRLFKLIAKRRRRLGKLADVIYVLPATDLALEGKSALQNQSLSLTQLTQYCADGTGRLYPTVLVVSHFDQLNGCQAFFDRADYYGEEKTWGALVTGQQWRDATPELLWQTINQRVQNMFRQVTDESVPVNLSGPDILARNGFPYQAQQLSQRLFDFVQGARNEFEPQAHPGFCGVFAVGSTKGKHESLLHGVSNSGFFKRQHAVNWRQEGGTDLLLRGVHLQLNDALKAAPVPSLKQAQRNLRKTVLTALVFMSTTVLALGMVYSDMQKQKQLIVDFRESVDQLAASYTSHSAPPMLRIGLLSTATQTFEEMQDQRSYLSKVGVKLPLIRRATVGRVERFLATALQDQFDSVLAGSLEQALEQKNLNWPDLNEQQKSAQRDEYYGLLEAYLMKTRVANRMEPQKAAAAVAPVWFEAMLQRSATPIDAPAIEVIENTLVYFYTHGFDHQQAARWTSHHYNEELVAAARSNLAVDSTADAIYQLLASRNQQRYEPVRLSDVIPPGYPYILRNDYQFSSMYSRNVWENHIKDEIRDTVQRVSMDDWVLDESYGARLSSAAVEPLETRVRELYFQDYRKHWEAYILAFYMPQFDTLDEVHHNLQLLGGERTPLKPLSLNIQYQLGAYQESETLRQPAGLLLNNGQSRFAPLNTFVEFYQADNPAQFEQYLEDINRLAAEVESMLAAARVSQEALQYASAMLSDQGSSQQLHALNLSINRTRLSSGPQAGELLQHVLLLPVKSTWQAVLNTAKGALQDEWERNVHAQYVAHLEGRFPFSASSEDSPISTFQDFFAADNGTLWRFHLEKTAPFVTLHRNSAERHTWLGIGLEFRQSYLNALLQGRQIGRAIRTQSDGRAGFRYALMPEPVAGVTESRFSQDDFLLTYRNEPQQWHEHSWVAGRQNSVARIQLRQSGQLRALTQQEEGSWSLLRLLYQAQATQVRNNEYELVWLLDDDNGNTEQARYKFRSDQAGLLLNRQLFSGYRLPRQIL